MNKGERTGLYAVIVILVLLTAVSVSVQRCGTDIPEDAAQKAREWIQSRDSVSNAPDIEENVTKNTKTEIQDAESPLKRVLPEIKD